MKKIIYAISIIFIAQSCFLYEDFTELVMGGENHSDEAVWFAIWDISECPNTFYDIGITLENYSDYFTLVEPDSTEIIFFRMGKREWKNVFPNDIRVHVWRHDLIQEMGWNSFLHENGFDSDLYEIEYELSPVDLETLEGLITYPPEGELLNMRIVYP